MFHSLEEGQVYKGKKWEGSLEINITIMAVKGNYVMARTKGCYPFVISVKEFAIKYKDFKRVL